MYIKPAESDTTDDDSDTDELVRKKVIDMKQKRLAERRAARKEKKTAQGKAVASGPQSVLLAQPTSNLSPPTAEVEVIGESRAVGKQVSNPAGFLPGRPEGVHDVFVTDSVVPSRGRRAANSVPTIPVPSPGRHAANSVPTIPVPSPGRRAANSVPTIPVPSPGRVMPSRGRVTNVPLPSPGRVMPSHGRVIDVPTASQGRVMDAPTASQGRVMDVPTGSQGRVIDVPSTSPVDLTVTDVKVLPGAVEKGGAKRSRSNSARAVYSPAVSLSEDPGHEKNSRLAPSKQVAMHVRPPLFCPPPPNT